MSKIKSALWEKQDQKQVQKKVQRVCSNLPVVAYENPYLEAAAEGGNEFGKLLRFVKGKYEIGDDEVPSGTEYIAHIDQTCRGWVKFEDSKVVGRYIGKIADGFRPQPREELSDADPKKWKEEDADGKPRDPWVKQWFVPLIGVEGNDFVTFVTGSHGGANAICNLLRVYGHRMADGFLPIIALKTSSYKHKKYGRIEEPDFPIVGWHGRPTNGKSGGNPNTGNAAANVDLDDSIPF